MGSRCWVMVTVVAAAAAATGCCREGSGPASCAAPVPATARPSRQRSRLPPFLPGTRRGTRAGRLRRSSRRRRRRYLPRRGPLSPLKSPGHSETPSLRTGRRPTTSTATRRRGRPASRYRPSSASWRRVPADGPPRWGCPRPCRRTGQTMPGHRTPRPR